ncbi:S-adenosyl-L-methionine-dependent methyltransferase [Sistotremastrum suecicum HHB10207 ss-3]|uniref:S-adenosyl-L-methionine-dependent methyltransferase n=1 Tax=Sistotremastrum suecicum HHB10207 ss-3 TaxID=1314776 RepID=A0A166GJ13_9AGAM|nr:S-adenosyl-L-methionine-dependent methyltransferase [Sistotremastrum suecicum HHB10207 ss-3]
MAQNPGDLRQLHGRGMNPISDAYTLPADFPEFDRLNLQHQIWKTVQRGLCPIPKSDLDVLLAPKANGAPSAILDLGCGSGIWCTDMAKIFPHANVVGFDLARSSPSDTPENCFFLQGNILDGLKDFYGQFDLVHSRTMVVHLKPNQRKWAINEITKCVRPGGIVILADWDEPILSEHGQILPAAREDSEPGTPQSWLIRILNEVWHRSDPVLTVVRLAIRDALAENARVDQETITSALHNIPIGWDDGSIENGALLGQMMRMDLMEFVRAFKPVLQSRGVGEQVIDSWIEHADLEFSGADQRVITRLHSTWARILE